MENRVNKNKELYKKLKLRLEYKIFLKYLIIMIMTFIITTHYLGQVNNVLNLHLILVIITSIKILKKYS